METYDARLRLASNICIAGPSQCGKSTLCNKLIKHRNTVFTEKPRQVLYFYGQVEPSIKLAGVSYKQGLPLENTDDFKDSLIILDDLMVEISGNDNILNLFTRVSHHCNCCIVFLTQNFYFKGMRTASLNYHYLFLFKFIRDKTLIHILARQMFPGRTGFLTSAYNDATSQKYGYLLIDMHPASCDEIRIRSNLFCENELFMIIYKQPLLINNE